MSWFNWSQTASANASADPSINWAEGQAPSSINDSARAMMAATAKYRDDNNGTLVTGGTSTAYTITSNSNYDTLAHLNGQTLTFVMSATSGSAPTLNVDSLGAKPIHISPGVAPSSGFMLLGSPYTVTYNNSNGEFLITNQPGVLVIPTSAVQYSNIQNETTNTLLGNVSGSSAHPAEITIGTGLQISGTTINAPAFAPAGTFKNLSIKVVTTTTVAAAADFVTMTDGTNYLTHSLSGTINLGTSGAANALDTGTIAIDTCYAIWAIAKSDGTTAALASTSFSSPTLPTGYTFSARIGSVRTIHASATLYGTWQLGRCARYIVGLAQTTTLVQMATGTAGNVTTPTWVSVSVSAFVPPTASLIAVSLTVSEQAGTGNTLAIVAPNNSYGGVTSTTNPPPIYLSHGGQGTSTVTQGGGLAAELLLESTNIYWANQSATTGSLWCLGWEDNI